MSNSISSNYSSSSTAALASDAKAIGGNLSNAQKALTDAAKSGDQGALAEAQAELQKQQTAFQAVMQMITDRFKTMRDLISNMKLS